jgi:D-alanine-D-alanine ligase
MKTRALVVSGSLTAEDKYGVISGDRVAEALTEHGWSVATMHASEAGALFEILAKRPPDVVVPVGFGSPCEDGLIHAVARMLGIPCAGPTPASGTMTLDKAATAAVVESIFDRITARMPRGITVTERSRPIAPTKIASLCAPFVVKPAFGGSSEGLAVFESAADALRHVDALLPQEGKVLIQELEQDIAREISCTVIDSGTGARFLPIVEVRRTGAIVLGPEEKFGPDAIGRHIVPADIAEDLRDRVERVVLTLAEAVGAVGLTRTDVLLTTSDEIVVLEINGIPGLLTSSIACDAASAAGIPFDELCVMYAESAFIGRAEPRIWPGTL